MQAVLASLRNNTGRCHALDLQKALQQHGLQFDDAELIMESCEIDPQGFVDIQACQSLAT